MTEGGLTLALLAGSAARSLLLGAGVFALLKLVRLRDLGAETMIWTAMLFAAMAMPLLSILSPAGLTLPLPLLAASAPASLVGAGPALPVTANLWVELLAWCVRHVAKAAWALYVLVAVVSLVRLAAGLACIVRLYQAAEPIREDWAGGRNIRVSATIETPLCFADCILLPADYRVWSNAKRLAVLAHEEAHIQRGDFFVQFLASIHRALFWFSPFAWWLQSKLHELAETASDQAAIRRIEDPAAYAEILVEVSRKARRAPVAMAMARGPDVIRRIDHILSDRPERPLGGAARLAALSGMIAASLGLAQVHAASAMPSKPLQPAALVRPNAAYTPGVVAVETSPGVVRPSRYHAKPTTKADPSAAPVPGPTSSSTPPDFTYNPRALLEDPDVAVVDALIPMGEIARRLPYPAVGPDQATTIGPGD